MEHLPESPAKMKDTFTKNIIEKNYDQFLELDGQRKRLLFSGIFLFFGFLTALTSYEMYLSRFSGDLIYVLSFSIYLLYIFARNFFYKDRPVNLGDLTVIGFLVVFYLLERVLLIKDISEARNILIFATVCVLPITFFGFQLARLGKRFSEILNPEIQSFLKNSNKSVSLISENDFDFKTALREPIVIPSSWSGINFAFRFESDKSNIIFADLKTYGSSKSREIIDAAIVIPEAHFGDRLQGVAHYPMEYTNFSKLKWPILVFIAIINILIYTVLTLAEAEDLWRTFFVLGGIISILIVAIASLFVIVPKIFGQVIKPSQYGDSLIDSNKYEQLREQLGGQVRSIGSLSERGAFVTYYVSPMDNPSRFISPYSSLFGSFLSRRRFDFIFDDLEEILRIFGVLESYLFNTSTK